MTIEEYKQEKEKILGYISNGIVKCENDCIDSKWCSACNGNCCKSFPCSFSPKEFIDLSNISYMKRLLDTGILAIAPFDKSFRDFHIRVRGLYDLDTIVTGFTIKNNPCMLLSTKGCLLDFTYRPSEGCLLVPGSDYIDEMCTQYYTFDDLRRDWSDYQGLLKKLIQAYKNKEIGVVEPSIEEIENYKRLLLSCNVKKGKKEAK